MKMRDQLIDVALGKAEADLVVRGGKILNVLSKEIYQADIAIKNGFIAAVDDLPEELIGKNTQILDAKNCYIAPGFIDAHIHFESSMLSLTEFCKSVISRGTTAIASDLMEVTIVAGMEAVREVFKEAESLPLRLYQTVPAFMSEEDELQTIGSTLHVGMIEEMLKGKHSVGLAEVLYPPILEKNLGVKKILELAEKMKKTAEGHAPALNGEGVNAYASVGIRSDHESTTREEALSKLRRGIRVLMREGSAATDLLPCLEVILQNKVDSRYCSMVSDDIDALHIYRKGHLDHKVRMAIQAGVDPLTAIQMVTINPAESLKIDHEVGSISPGKYADLLVLSDLHRCEVRDVLFGGKIIIKDKSATNVFVNYKYPQSMMETIHIDCPIKAEELEITINNQNSTVKAYVIGANGTTLLTKKKLEKLRVADHVVQANKDQDILHIACVERYGKRYGIGRSFVQGFGLKEGAMATSVGHDHHNITAVGTNTDDMAIAINSISDMGGGIAIVKGGRLIEAIPLPILGLLSTEPGEVVADKLETIQNTLREWGCSMQSPFMTLAFITLIYIPELAITDRGLIDVIAASILEPVISD